MSNPFTEIDAQEALGGLIDSLRGSLDALEDFNGFVHSKVEQTDNNECDCVKSRLFHISSVLSSLAIMIDLCGRDIDAQVASIFDHGHGQAPAKKEVPPVGWDLN